MKSIYEITLKIKRYDPDTGRSWTQSYNLKAGRILRFTDVFRKINNEIDPSLAWNSSCEHAQCGTCAVVINGKPVLACELLVENAVRYFNTTVFKVKPITVAPVIRDLVVDLEQAYKRVEKIRPYLIQPLENPNPDNEYPVSPRELDSYVDATRCVNCFCCATACISSHHGFLGPNAMLAAIVRLMDPREAAKKERLKILYGEQGLYRCHTSMACTFVCPKEIDVAHFLALAKSGNLKTPPKDK